MTTYKPVGVDETSHFPPRVETHIQDLIDTDLAGKADETDLTAEVTRATTAEAAVQAYAIQRSHHTGTQLSTTISDFVTAVEAVAGRVMVVDNGDGTVTVTTSGGGFVLVDNGDGTVDLTLDGTTVTLGAGERTRAIAAELALQNLTNSTFVSNLHATVTGHINGLRDMVDKLRSQQQPVNLLIVTDSSGDRTTGGPKWTTGLGAAIGALFPTHDVYDVDFDYTTTNNWLAPVLAQTGSGYRSDLSVAPVFKVWVAGWSQHNWSDWLQDSRRDKVFGYDTVGADVTMFALGHNDGTNNMTVAPIRDRDLGYIEWVRTLNPRTQIVLSSQNVRPGGGSNLTALSPGHAELRNDIYRTLARQCGYGYINMTQAFHDDGRSLVPGAVGGLIEGLNGVHPSQPDGYNLWRSVFMQQVVTATGAVPLPTSVPALTRLGKRVVGMDTRPILSNGWTATAVSEAIETTIIRGASTSSIKLTKTSGSNARVNRTLPIGEVAGKGVTAFAWIYVPSGVADVKTTIGIFVNGSLAVSSLTDQTLLDQWYPICLTHQIPASATSASVRLWVDNDTSADAPSIYVDSFDVLLGNQPAVGYSAAGTGSTLPVNTWSGPGTQYNIDVATFGGAMYQSSPHTSSASFRTDLAAGLWTHVSGHGRVESINPTACAATSLAFPGASRQYYYRVESAAAISNFLIEVGTQSGNIMVSAYQNNGAQGRSAAPGTLIASTGSIACPAVGLATLAIGSTIGVAAGDWIAFACDNVTAKFRTPSGNAGASGVGTGRVGFENLGSFAAPSSPGSISWAPTYVTWVGAS